MIRGEGFSYDADGRLFSRTAGSDAVAHGYDYAERAASMTLNGGTTTLVYQYIGDRGLQWPAVALPAGRAEGAATAHGRKVGR